MITIIDYGLGNIRAFVNVFERLNIKTIVAQSSKDLERATKLILPGVGSFDYAINLLNKSGMRDTIENKVLLNKVPVLGICLGMHLFANYSEEGTTPGLGWVEGEVILFNADLIPYKTRLPHMGWNTIQPINNNSLLSGFNGDSRFYFLHSYYFECNNTNDVISTTEYGNTYTSALNKNNIFGIQFHPEKSHSNGIKLLKNFALL